MHQGTVSVAIDMYFKALVRTVPSYLTEIVAVAWPVAETIKVLDDTHSNFIRRQVQKCISQGHFGLEIGWHMEEVIRAREAFIVQ